ncbi:hypothetical protein RR46_11329 [Papilio xuthus]|uniref:Uncharacterized protein n=1 Tax=Papilio xuthus TaxID=66420 RepID=A0A194PQ95_PAPXU|nr:hypothetical protein RR46_11329 [Papilio xuthus]
MLRRRCMQAAQRFGRARVNDRQTALIRHLGFVTENARDIPLAKEKLVARHAGLALNRRRGRVPLLLTPEARRCARAHWSLRCELAGQSLLLGERSPAPPVPVAARKLSEF